jgi:hypothetical protein
LNNIPDASAYASADRSRNDTANCRAGHHALLGLAHIGASAKKRCKYQ